MTVKGVAQEEAGEEEGVAATTEKQVQYQLTVMHISYSSVLLMHPPL